MSINTTSSDKRGRGKRALNKGKRIDIVGQGRERQSRIKKDFRTLVHRFQVQASTGALASSADLRMEVGDWSGVGSEPGMREGVGRRSISNLVLRLGQSPQSTSSRFGPRFVGSPAKCQADD
jgi:hypothetical protein